VERAPSPAEIFYGPLRWSSKAELLKELLERDPSEEARRYFAQANSAAKFTW
jgi:hypothetical protein